MSEKRVKYEFNGLEYAAVRFGGCVLAFPKGYDLEPDEWEAMLERAAVYPYKVMPGKEEQAARRVNERLAYEAYLATLDPRRMPLPPERATIITRDNSACRYCGVVLTEKKVTIDHIIPHSRRGRTSIENMVVACRKCNSRKHDRTPEEAKMILLPVPSTASA